jgi:hypothetical protein
MSMFTVLSIAVVLVTAALATPHAKLKAWWQVSTAKLLYDEFRRQLDAAQAQPRPTPPPAQGEQAK